MTYLQFLDVVDRVYSIADMDMPVNIHTDKDGLVCCEFNYGGLWFSLCHCTKWSVAVYREYDDMIQGNISECICDVLLGHLLIDVTSYQNGKMIIIGNEDCYVFNPDEEL